MAVNRLKISVTEFYEMTAIEFDFAMKDWREQEEEKAKVTLEGFRYLAMHLWNAQGRKVKRLLTNPKEIGVFEWEKEEPTKQGQTVDQMKVEALNIYYHFKNMFNKKEKQK